VARTNKQAPAHVVVRPKRPRRGQRNFKPDTNTSLVRRFIKKTKKEKIQQQVRNLRYYEKPSTRRRMARKARKRVLDKLREQEKSRANSL
tara:strand:+ start:325 stop:594 length:270 start_codon:yes stop_codon:yes gene_type:complete